MTQQYRQPTFDEAVEQLQRPLNDKHHNNRCIELWRSNYGNEFADKVKRHVTQLWTKAGKEVKF
jgi:hypothetical protein